MNCFNTLRSSPVHAVPCGRMLPPEQLFARLRSRPGAVFLDSASPYWNGDRWEKRYSILAADPVGVIRSLDELSGWPLGSPHAPDTPFRGGAIGFISYGLRCRLEALPDRHRTTASLPDLHLAVYDKALVYDHDRREYTFYYTGEREADARTACDAWLEEFANNPAKEPSVTPHVAAAPLDAEAYLRAVKRCKEHIRAGDIYQANLSAQLQVPLTRPPYETYLQLRTVNPAPFSAFLSGDDRLILSASPERFIRVAGAAIETHPIKGTRKRGASPAEDADIGRQLLASEKDRAELAMIVDVQRNDLGRLCEFGSVNVAQPCFLQMLPSLIHLVARVEGRLRLPCSAADVIRATFPGGSITGAPKIRAMEIIDELETYDRGIYTGSIGWIGFDGCMDFNIAIRTALVRNDAATLYTGAGIVADSEPERELQELRDKVAAMVKGIQG